SAQRVVVYADARQRGKREGWTASLAGALKSLRWQSAALAPLLYGGATVGLLTAIYKVGDVPYEADTTFLTALAAQAATAAVNAKLLAATREKVALEERQRLARELHDSISQSLYAIRLEATTARERLDQNPAGATQPMDHVV